MIRGTPKYVIVDLDGCLSDDRWRRDLLPGGHDHSPERYDAYHAECGGDPQVLGVLSDVLRDACDERGHQVALIVVATARPHRHNFREITRAWLGRIFCGLEYELLMRPRDSDLPSAVVKMHAINTFFEGAHGDALTGWQRVISAYDDRPDILASYPIEPNRRQLRALPIEKGGVVCLH